MFSSFLKLQNGFSGCRIFEICWCNSWRRQNFWRFVFITFVFESFSKNFFFQKTGTDLLLAERQRLQCQSVFQQISHNTDKGPRGTVTYDEVTILFFCRKVFVFVLNFCKKQFTTFLRDQYGLDIEMHEILKHEIHCCKILLMSMFVFWKIKYKLNE